MKLNTFITLGMAMGISLLILASALLDAQDKAIEQAERRRDNAAQALCEAEMGPATTVLWTNDGDLVCRPSALTAGGAQ